MRILKLPKAWQGWYFWEDYFVDPEDNRYSVEMVRSSLFTKYQTMTITWGDTL